MIITFFDNLFNHASRVFVFLFGAFIGSIAPTFNFISVCFFALLLDCFTAWRLAQRVKKVHNNGDGKIKSQHIGKVFKDYAIICLVIILCHFIDTEILTFVDNMYLANVVAAAFSLNQVLSILENESSCNGSRWAEILQKVLIDKTSRHLDINLKDKENGTGTNNHSQGRY